MNLLLKNQFILMIEQFVITRSSFRRSSVETSSGCSLSSVGRILLEAIIWLVLMQIKEGKSLNDMNIYLLNSFVLEYEIARLQQPFMTTKHGPNDLVLYSYLSTTEFKELTSVSVYQ